MRFTDRLLEEEPDFAELSAISFDSPGPAPPKSVFARLAAGGVRTNKGLDSLTEDNIFGGPQVHKDNDEDTEEDLDDECSLLDVQLEPEHDPENLVPDAPDMEAEDNPDEERTIVFSKVSSSALADPPLSSSEDIQSQTTASLAEAQSSSDSSSKVTKVRITPELENVVVSVDPFTSFLAHLLSAL